MALSPEELKIRQGIWSRRWDLKNPEKKREIGRKWRAANKDKVSAMNRRAYEKTREQRLAYQKAWYLNNRERNLARQTNKRRNTPQFAMVASAKKRAKERGLAFDLDAHALTIPEKCPVLGIPIFVGLGKLTDNSPTIDRIDNKGGYTKDNILVCSYRANRIKSDATCDELIRIVNFYQNLKSYE